MRSVLLDLPTWLSGVLIVGAAVSWAVGGMLLTRATVSRLWRAGRIDQDATNYFAASLTAVYGIVLAFFVFDILSAYNSAQSGVTAEAGTVASLYRDSSLVTQPERGELRGLLRQYTQRVIVDDWPAMAHGGGSPLVTATVNRLYMVTSAHWTSQLSENRVLRQGLDRLSDERFLRVEASGPAVNDLFWLVLIVGAMLALGASYLVYLDTIWGQTFVTGSLGLFLGTLVFFVFVLDHPFTGAVRVSDEPFQQVLRLITSAGS